MTKEDVLKIAKLANLEIQENEIEKFSIQLTEILGYLNKLSEVDTSQIDQEFTVIKDLKNRLQTQPLSTQTLETKEALKNAQNHTDKHFVTDAVL